jgi:hypothetical protein
MNAKLRHQPIANESADNADDHVTNEPKPGPIHEVAGQPSGHNANQQYDKETFV